MTYLVVDIETTGLSKYYHKITEIAAVQVKNNKIIKEFQTLVNPKVHIPSFITRLTGIDNSMVKDAPTIKEVMPKFSKFLGDRIFVAHNASFDYGFLNVNAEKEIENSRLCTRKLANRLLPDLYSKKLGSLCDYFGIRNNQAHRAMGDTLATTQLLNSFLEMLDEKGVKSVDDILKFEKMPRKKILENFT